MLQHLENRKYVERVAAEYLHERDQARTKSERYRAKERYFRRTDHVRHMAEKVWEEIMVGGLRPKLQSRTTDQKKKHGNCIPVVVETWHWTEEFPSQKEAAKALGISVSRISTILNSTDDMLYWNKTRSRGAPFKVYRKK